MLFCFTINFFFGVETSRVVDALHALICAMLYPPIFSNIVSAALFAGSHLLDWISGNLCIRLRMARCFEIFRRSGMNLFYSCFVYLHNCISDYIVFFSFFEHNMFSMQYDASTKTNTHTQTDKYFPESVLRIEKKKSNKCTSQYQRFSKNVKKEIMKKDLHCDYIVYRSERRNFSKPMHFIRFVYIFLARARKRAVIFAFAGLCSLAAALSNNNIKSDYKFPLLLVCILFVPYHSVRTFLFASSPD